MFFYLILTILFFTGKQLLSFHLFLFALIFEILLEGVCDIHLIEATKFFKE